MVGVLVDFAHALRAARLPVGTGEVQTYCAAMTALDPSDLVDLYWAGRARSMRTSGRGSVSFRKKSRKTRS